MRASSPPALPPGFSDPRPLAGSAGLSFRARYRGQECVLRLADPESSRGQDQAWSELAGLAGLDPHPGLARLLDHGESEGQLWLAREWIEGQSLADLARQGLAPEDLAVLTVRLSSALEALHCAGWVHGDLKAENIVVAAESEGPGVPVLTDLGSTRLSGSVRELAGGSLFGMAPEILLGHELDARVDVFALGVMLAALLLPESGVDAAQFYSRFPHNAGFFEAAGMHTSALPAWASGLVERCVARSPGDRPQSALEVGAEIARRLELPRPIDSGAFELRLGPRSGRESWFADFVAKARESREEGSAPAVSLILDTSEPLEAFERELRLDAALAGLATHSLNFEPRRLEGVAALDRFIESALPEEGGHVFFVDRGSEEAAPNSWREMALSELLRSARERPDLRLVRVLRSKNASGSPAGGESSWTELRVPHLDRDDLSRFLAEGLENGHELARVQGLADRLDRDAGGSWTRVNAALEVATERGWLAPGENAPHLFEAHFEESLLPQQRTQHVLGSSDARRVLAVLEAREGRSHPFRLAERLGVDRERRAQIEAELLRQTLVVRDAGRLVLTDLGHGASQVCSNGFTEEDLCRVLELEAETREAAGEDAGEISLLRLRAKRPEAAAALRGHAAETRERGAPARALDWLQRALEVESLSAGERALILGEWCVTQAALGRPERALEACRELERNGEIRAAARTRARVYTLRRDFDAAQAEWEKAASAPGAGLLEHGEALFGEVRRLAEGGRLSELEQRVAEMEAGVHGALDPRQLLNARNLLAAVRVRSGTTTESLEELRQLLREAREAEDRALEAGVALNLATALRRGGGDRGLEEALELFEAAAQIHAEDGHLPGLAQARAALGGTLREAGRVTEATASLRSALSIRERIGDARGAAGVRGMLGLALADRGELADAGSELERAAEELRSEHQLPGPARLFEARAELVRARLGRRERLHYDAADFDLDRDDPRIALSLGRAAAIRGRRPEARMAVTAALEASQRRGWSASAAEAERLLIDLELDGGGARSGGSVAEGLCGRVEAGEGAAGGLPGALCLSDHRLISCLIAEAVEDGGGAAEEELLRLARELEASGRRDRAARAWFAVARRTRDAERAEHARKSAEREFRACSRGLSEPETQRLKKTLLSIPDPCPSDLDEAANAVVERREEELQALLDIQARLVDQEDLPSLLGKIVECSLEIAGGERGFLLLEEEGELVFDTALDSRRGEDIAAPEVEVSRSVIRRALEVGRPLRLSNATADPLLGAAPSVTALELRSILCTPFEVQPRLRGVIYLDHRLRTGAFGDRAEELLMHLAGQAALAIRQVRRVAEIRRLNEKLSRRVIDAEADLQSARRALEDAGLAGVQKTGLVGRSEGMRSVRALLERAAPSRLPVLVQGQSGTGKELAARALHEQAGSRRGGPFVSESCAALPESLIESELFGYRRGAFTGAEDDRPGIFERAHGGTLFLDEIGELPLDLQAKLLRVLETGRVRRLGDAEELRVDFRLVAATNRDLEQEVAEGRFRADLRYRLDALRVQMPSLATRLEDVPLLVEHFLKRESDQVESGRTRRVSDSVMAALCRRPWPGNVRELANEVARLCVLSEGDLVDEELVRIPAPTADTGLDSAGIETLESVERRVILAAVEACGDDKRRAAKELGISRAKIYQKLKAWRARGLIE